MGERELPVRKNIRLSGYDYSQAGYYYVTICVKDRLELLGKLRVGDDAHIVPPYIELSQYGKIAKKYIESINTYYADISVDNHIIMPDHIHLILVIRKSAGHTISKQSQSPENGGTMWASSPTAARIPSIIRSFKTLVSKECGYSFWQRAYHDHIINNEVEYQEIYRYINNNPQKWYENIIHMFPKDC